jgi:hypothetical protein
MIFLPLDIREKLLTIKHYKKSSIDTMDQQIMRIHKLLFLTHFDIETLKNLSIIKPLFELHFDKSSITKAIANTIIQILKLDSSIDTTDWDIWFKIVCLQQAHDYQYKEPTAVELANRICMSDVRKLFETYQNDIKLKKQSKFFWLKYTILAVYSLFPPLRGQDWYDTMVVKIIDNSNPDVMLAAYNTKMDAQKCNIYNILTGQLVLKFYKTSKTYGVRVLTLPDELQTIIKEWMKINRTQFLFPTMKTGLPMTQQTFTHRLNSIFSPKKVSTSMLRKIYVSEMIPTITVAQRKELSLIMAHSLSSQEFVYKKF